MRHQLKQYNQIRFYPNEVNALSGFKIERLYLLLPEKRRNMALATFVKISAVNNLSDARYCAGMDVDQLGFVIEEGEASYLSPKDFNEIAEWLSGVAFVGEVFEASSDIKSITQAYALDAIQIAHAEQIEEALQTGLEVIFYTADVATANAISKQYPQLSYVLYDGPATDAIQNPSKIVITDGFEADNIKGMLKTKAWKGIAMQGGDEIRPGYKDFDELADILEALDTDEYA